jgi:hypothetical protein
VAVDTSPGPLAQALLQCLCTALETSIAGPVCQCCLHPGTVVPMDLCCDCGTGQGQAAVRIVSIYPTRSFPTQTFLVERCPPGELAVVLEMTVYRCAATMDDAGNPPSCAAMTHDALVAADDAGAMRCAALCCFGQLDPDLLVVLGAWQPLGVAGACHGGSMQVTVRASNLCPPAP